MATNTNPFYTYSATAGSSKTLQKPQDGGDNNQWGNYINTDLDEIVAAVNALSDKIADANEKTLVDFTATGSAVNHIGITNAAAGNGPTISAAGSESDVDLNVTAKGTGDINLTPGTNGDVNIPASKGITFGDDGEKIEGDGTDLTIASSNDLNLTATTDINVPADVGLTFGNDGEKIEGDGTDLTIASSATLNVNTGSSSGNNLKVNTSQLVVEGDTGNTGVGQTNPASRLEVGGDTSTVVRIASNSSNGDPSLQLWDRQTTQLGQVKAFQSGGTVDHLSLGTGTNQSLNIKSNGNVGIGTDLSGNNANNLTIRKDSLNNVVDTLLLNNGSADNQAGTGVRINMSGASEASSDIRYSYIESATSSTGNDHHIAFGTNAAGSTPAERLRITNSGNTRPGAHNTYDLGTSAYKWDDIYATNGTIITSDRNEKQDIEELYEAEQRVAVAAKGLLRKYRWKSAVAEKGDDARIHFGIIAQDLKEAFEAEGLDAGRYGMLIYSEWWESEETYTDDDGVEKTRINTYDTEEEAPDGAIKKDRMGVRYSELLAFIIAAI